MQERMETRLPLDWWSFSILTTLPPHVVVTPEPVPQANSTPLWPAAGLWRFREVRR